MDNLLSLDDQEADLPSCQLVSGFHPETHQYTGPVPAWLSPLERCYPLPAYATTLPAPDSPAPAHHAWRLNAKQDAWECVPDYREVPLYSTESGQQLPALAFGEAPPVNSTTQPPPWPGAREAREWDTEAQQWVLRPDWRGVALWRTADAMPVSAALGQTPADLHATELPPPPFAIWKGDHWGVDEAVKPETKRWPELTEQERAAQARTERDQRLTATEWLVQRHRDETDLGRPATLKREEFDQLMAYRQALRDIPMQSGFPDQVDWPILPDLK
ncbi:phage tail assembly chaperone [Chromobacterium amazonense]|uniref:Phage tail assembly chaperone n=1 Tax=Chromobacterium amazonense TaxID=1382803 RepID=A0ABU8V2J4_9NEIS|nr:phage tail assembly chaperone [Chromobacterium amazonense]MDQ4540735.1 phage tail assembly chaperone [Chromobacterium amazonense]